MSKIESEVLSGVIALSCDNPGCNFLYQKQSKISFENNQPHFIAPQADELIAIACLHLAFPYSRKEQSRLPIWQINVEDHYRFILQFFSKTNKVERIVGFDPIDLNSFGPTLVNLFVSKNMHMADELFSKQRKV